MGQVLGCKEENTENKNVKMFIIVGDNEKPMGVHYAVFFTFIYAGKVL